MRFNAPLFYRNLLYRPVTALLAVWLAVFAPVMCQIHGLMLDAPMTGAAGRGEAYLTSDHSHQAVQYAAHHAHSAHIHTRASAPHSGPGYLPLMHHDLATNATMLMSLMVAAVPAHALALTLSPIVALPLNRFVFPQHPELPPLDPPPRTS